MLVQHKSLKPTKYMQLIPGDDEIVGAILSETTYTRDERSGIFLEGGR